MNKADVTAMLDAMDGNFDADKFIYSLWIRRKIESALEKSDTDADISQEEFEALTNDWITAGFGHAAGHSVKKDAAMEVIGTMPDEFSIEEFMYRVELIDSIKKGEDDVRNNRLIPNDEMMHQMRSWLK